MSWHLSRHRGQSILTELEYINENKIERPDVSYREQYVNYRTRLLIRLIVLLRYSTCIVRLLSIAWETIENRFALFVNWIEFNDDPSQMMTYESIPLTIIEQNIVLLMMESFSAMHIFSTDTIDTLLFYVVRHTHKHCRVCSIEHRTTSSWHIE
jgi:hypothetical protein